MCKKSPDTACLTQVFTGAASSSSLLGFVHCTRSDSLNQQDQVHGCLTAFTPAALYIWITFTWSHVIICTAQHAQSSLNNELRPLGFYHPPSACGLLPISNCCQPPLLHSQVFHKDLWSTEKALLQHQGSEV